MADEITLNGSIAVRKGSLQLDRRLQPVRVDLAGDQYEGKAITLTDTAQEVELPVGFVPGYCLLRNLGDTNDVEVGIDVSETFHPFLLLKPGEFALLRLGTDEIEARTDAGSSVLEYLILEA